MRQQLNIDNVVPKKSLGQNFITDKNFLLKMERCIITSKNNSLIEIGPGKGALTNYLLKKNFKKLYLIEKDYFLADLLKNKFKNNKNIIVSCDDALKFNFNQFRKKNVIIFGNLPFNISTRLLTLWLSDNIWPSFFDKMILMFQKEVGDRIIAGHNSKKYGRLSVLVQSRCSVKKLLNAPSSIFSPKPKVDGTVLQFEPITKYKEINITKLANLLEKSFRSRRKKIKNTLKDYKHHLQNLNIDDNLRPENLSVSNYCDLVKLID